MEALRKNSLSPERRNLVELMQRIGYGRIYSLAVRNGEPVFDTKVSARRSHVFGKSASSPSDASHSDFLLKEKVLELLREFDRIGSFTVLELVIENGLPVRMTVEERVAA